MERLQATFDSVAGESLRANSESFLRLAREHLGQHQQSAAAALVEREKAIESLLTPIREALTKTEQQMLRIEKRACRDLRQPQVVARIHGRSAKRHCSARRVRS